MWQDESKPKIEFDALAKKVASDTSKPAGLGDAHTFAAKVAAAFACALLLTLSTNAEAQSGTFSKIIEYPAPATAELEEISAGTDGALWFTDFTGKVGRITTNGAITEYPTPHSQNYGITAGPDGALWFTEQVGYIGRITVAGVITEFPLAPGTVSYGITAGPDGALWFAESSANNIGRITTAGGLTEYPLPNSGSVPYEVAVGSDGAIWFTEFDGNRVGRITTGGVIAEYAVPTPAAYPAAITSGPDGALWFTENGANRIGRITTAGVISEYLLPTPGSYPSGVTSGPDGAVWFTEDRFPSKLGRITTGGLITEYPVPGGASVWRITAGPDGGLWTTEEPPGIGRAPACGLGFSASFNNDTLTMSFSLGINIPAAFHIHLRNTSGPIGQPFSKQISAVVPPQEFTMNWSPFPNLGEVIVEPSLATQPGGTGLGLCAEWTTVNTSQ